LEQDELLDKSGVVLDGIGYIHGHTIPSAGLKDQLIVTGHHHPMIAIRDEVGCALRSPAYLLATLSPDILFKARNTGGKRGRAAGNRGVLRALLMPAFNECSGYDVSRIIRHPFSPISRAIVRESAEVLLTDGTYIGPAALLEEPDGAA
jgi:metallophosphoesterase superfamily enzyme